MRHRCIDVDTQTYIKKPLYRKVREPCIFILSGLILETTDPN